MNDDLAYPGLDGTDAVDRAVQADANLEGIRALATLLDPFPADPKGQS